MAPATRTVLYAACDRGYIVYVYQAGNSQPIDTYTAGNNQRDSQSFVEPDSVDAVSPRDLCIMSRLTASRIAGHHGVPARGVIEDADLLEHLYEMLCLPT